ncbi:MAG: hypothetical protein ACREOG_11645 [Gemmatimonadaceae bacterium]
MKPNKLASHWAAAAMCILMPSPGFAQRGIKMLDSVVLANARPISMTDNRLAGPGAALLLDDARSATLVALGEEHNAADDSGRRRIIQRARSARVGLRSVFGATPVLDEVIPNSDFDDGIDIDESGDGSIVGGFLLTSANNNLEQGFDLNENDAGDLRVDMTLVEAIGNLEEDSTGITGGDVAREFLCLFTEGLERRASRERLHCDLLS